MKLNQLYIITIMLAAMGLNGCLGTSKPSRFYLLQALPESQTHTTAQSDAQAPSVLIGPIAVPAYLDRTQVVIPGQNHEVRVDEFTRWAEPLPDSFYRILMENLSYLLNTAKIYSFDQRSSVAADFQVMINVTRFDSAKRQGASLTAFWSIVGPDGDTVLVKRKSVLHQGVASDTVDDNIAAQNNLLSQFSREIAEAIRANAKSFDLTSSIENNLSTFYKPYSRSPL